MGRAGRRLPDHPGKRARSVTYNSNDLAVVGVTDDVRELCANTDGCSKDFLRFKFIGGYLGCPNGETSGAAGCVTVLGRCESQVWKFYRFY